MAGVFHRPFRQGSPDGLEEEKEMTSIEAVVNLARLIDEGGTYICSKCPHYEILALKNCALGFAAPSDCPKVIKAAVEAVRLLEAEKA